MWGDRVFLTQPISESNLRALICLDRQTGQELWQRGIAYSEPEPSHKTNPCCSASPVTDGERVIAWFGSAGLICYDFEGKELWRRDLGKQDHMWGSDGGHDELVAALPRRVVALNPSTGERLWTCGGAAPLAYASPMKSDDTIVVLGGYGGASLAVRAGGQDDVTSSGRVWHRPNDSGWLGTGVAHDGAIYICGMGGVLSCIDVQSGDELWKQRIGGGGTWSSITQAADGRMFLLTKSGTTTVFEPDRKKFKEVAVNELNESTNASVVIAGSDLLIRTDRALWSFTSDSQPQQAEQ